MPKSLHDRNSEYSEPDTATYDVVLVSMPFTPLTHPSLGLSCLAGALRKQEIRVKCLYPALDFAGRIGIENYVAIINGLVFELAGDWVFSGIAFPEHRPDDAAYLSSHCQNIDAALMRAAREAAIPFVDDTARRILSLRPKIVGCTSMFHQNAASLALLRRVRDMEPGIVTVMGGANCEGAMGLEMVRNFPWLDYAFSGESDVTFPELCRSIISGPARVDASGWMDAGVFTPRDRDNGHHAADRRGVVQDLSVLPDPVHDDYFEELAASSVRDHIVPGVLIETSRGCWWGEKSSCSFCGLNGLSRKYRCKLPDQIHDEIGRLSARHGMTAFEMTDNMLQLSFLDDLLPRFKGRDMLFLYEVSPTLTREQIRTLQESGVRWVQPGFEHLHPDGLRALNKGNQVYHNLRFLKWARQYGITLAWNFLYAFPGERDDWLDDVCRLIPLICHFQPPATLHCPLRYDRFSRYHNHQEQYGLDLRPFPAYSFIYPLGEEQLSRLAYYFKDHAKPGPFDGSFTDGQLRLLRVLYEWKYLFPGVKPYPDENGKLREFPMLGMRPMADGSLVFTDTRPAAVAAEHVCSGFDRAVYEACDGGETVEGIAGRLAESGFPAADTEAIAAALQRFIDKKLMLLTCGRYLSLALELPVIDYLSLSRRPGGRIRRRPVYRPVDHPSQIGLEQTYGIRL